MKTFDSRVDKVAQEIANWGKSREENLLKKLVDLNYHRGLKALAKKFKKG